MVKAQRDQAERGKRGQTPLRSPVKWALLGLIIEEPSYVYDLAQRFERRYGTVLSLGDVRYAYAAVSALGARGLVEEIPGTREGSNPKPCYKATAEGVEEYRKWLIGQVGEDRKAHQFFVLALSALSAQPEQMIEVVELCEQEWLNDGMARLLARAGTSAVAREEDTSTDWLAPLLDRLIEEENRLTVGAKLKWVQYAREQLGELPGSGGHGARRTEQAERK